MKAAGLRLGSASLRCLKTNGLLAWSTKPWYAIGARAGLAFLGRADIGHDADNRIVPFGLAGRARGQ
jgi:muramoyltetrapeptide carboxypeptidase